MRITLLAAASAIAMMSGAAVAQDSPPAAEPAAEAPAAPAPAAADSITEAELAQFATAMAAVQPIAAAAGGAPSAEQQAAMAAAIQASGLQLERFNAISGAVSQDERLRARVALADARRGG